MENNFFNRLLSIQMGLKAPKDLNNKFGGYKYRSAESILEAVKPLLQQNQLVLTLTDSIELIGDRYYIKATATINDTLSDKSISVSAYAREEESKKGMDSSQVTGSTSSYARKYALNGLFNIDDNKDADTNEFHEITQPKSTTQTRTEFNYPFKVNQELIAKARECGIDFKKLAVYKKTSVEELTNEIVQEAISQKEARRARA